MKIEIARYSKEALEEDSDYFQMHLYLTESELLSLVSSLSNIVFEKRERGLDYEVPRKIEVGGREVKIVDNPESFTGRGEIIFRMVEK